MLDIQDFLAHIGKYGIARDNRFDFVLDTLPTGLMTNLSTLGIDSNATNKGLSIMVKSISEPGINFSTVERNDNSLTRKVAYDRSFGDLDVVFICSANMYEKKLFDEWKNLIFKKNKMVEYYDNYITNATFQIRTQSSDYFDIAYRVKIKELYPVTVTPISVDKTTENQILTFQVTFVIRDITEDSPEYEDTTSSTTLSTTRTSNQQSELDLMTSSKQNNTGSSIDKAIFKSYNPTTQSPSDVSQSDSSIVSGYNQQISSIDHSSTSAAILALRSASAALNINRILEEISKTDDPKQIIILLKEVQANVERSTSVLSGADMTAITNQINNILYATRILVGG